LYFPEVNSKLPFKAVFIQIFKLTMNPLKAILLFVLCQISWVGFAQTISPAILEKPWKAQWITGPGKPISIWTAASDRTLKEYGVYKFRKTVELSEKPSSFIVHVSADNRYKLFVNGKQVSQGPARGDLYFWNFETVDLAPHLQTGKNTIAALVWNEGSQKPEAQISYLTGFILQGNTQAEEVLNTDSSWKSIKDSSYQALPVRVPGYYVAGPAEFVNMNQYVKGWEKTAYDDSHWGKVRMLGPGLTKNTARDSRGWMLVPSPIPQMEMTPQRLVSLRKAEGIKVPATFPATKSAITIPAHTQATLLLDQSYLTNAYPTLIFSRGKNAGISMGYAEALYIRKNENISGYWIPTLPKANRNEVDGKTFIGKVDSVISDGSTGQEFTPLWWRTYRYIQLKVYTQDEPLIIEDIFGTFIGYPFQYNVKLDAPNPELGKMLDIGWRTARLCAFETYMDCPFYEQLQYIGDARIQALVSFYNSGDDRLVRHALSLMDHSRLAEGITLSRYPTDLHQQIPTFSLWWIGMLHDYWMYRPDSSFIKGMLPGERQVLSFFERYQQADGSLKNVPYWIFTDWVSGNKNWIMGMAPVGSNGESAVLDLQLLWTYQLAAQLEEKMGLQDFSKLYTARAEQLKQTIHRKYWDETRQLYADTETKDKFSQHTNSLAILSGVISGEKATALAQKILVDTTLAPASIYFKYYLHQALVKAGLGNEYLSWLDKWRENIAMGMSTWGESSDVSTTRSDCHAWGSSPNVEFFRTVLGIDSDAPGFAQVKIEPHLGTLKMISGEMPHPNGKIAVSYVNKKNKWNVSINLPENTSGFFQWKGQRYMLKSGANSFSIQVL
jgi:alpha-L-rhamnosidase